MSRGRPEEDNPRVVTDIQVKSWSTWPTQWSQSWMVRSLFGYRLNLFVPLLKTARAPGGRRAARARDAADAGRPTVCVAEVGLTG